jgi:hypothetical protein
MLGAMASKDPEADELYRQIMTELQTLGPSISTEAIAKRRELEQKAVDVLIARRRTARFQCSIEVEVFPRGAGQPVRPGPYAFPDARAATAFATEAIEALMYLGCDVQAQ